MRRSPLRSVSRKRAAENRTYTKLRAEYLAEHPYCEASARVMSLEPDCHMRGQQVHHMRGRVGADFLDTTTWLAVCCVCHQWITEHPEWAIRTGLSERRNSA